MTQPTHLDLFSGIGGFALAAGWAGFKTIGFSEIDPYASAVLKKHWPDVPNYGDVRTVPAIRCDLITGGFPCQPFSCAGKRRGKDDDRYLWPAMLEVITRCRPAWVLGENVAGIEDLALDQVLLDLETNGYTALPIGIPACAVGAFHKRKRVWIVAHTAINGCKRIQRSIEAQISEDGTPETLDPWHGTSNPFGHWEKLMAEPCFRRMDDGVSSSVDVRPRLRSYGNSIVPQVAFQIIKAIRTLI